MSEANANTLCERDLKKILIAVTIIVLAVAFLIFWDRQQKRAFELEKLENRMNVLEEWPPTNNAQQNRMLPAGGDKVL